MTCEWSFALRKLKVPRGTQFLVYRGPLPIDKARTFLVKEALKHDCTHVFFLDGDVIPPENAVDLLLSQRHPIVSGVYPDKGGRANAWKNRQPMWVESGGQVVDEVGLGCCLIDARVFKRVPEPWFLYEHDGYSNDKPSEDIFFCRKARENGFSVLVLGNVKARHCFVGAMVDPRTITHLVF